MSSPKSCYGYDLVGERNYKPAPDNERIGDFAPNSSQT